MQIPNRQPAARLRRAFRAGFTFLEVLFAVIILGVGFIMLAGMFPVAIRQQQASIEDTAAPVVGGEAVSMLSNIFRDYNQSNNLVPTGDTQNVGSPLPLKVFTFRDHDPAHMSATKGDAAWSAIMGNLIVPADPAYAWVPFYMRDKDATISGVTALPYASTARVIVVVVRARNKQHYDTLTDAFPSPSPSPPAYGANAFANLEPNYCTASVKTGTPDTITLTPKSGFASSTIAAAAPGTYIIVSDDKLKGVTNGFYFQLGQLLGSASNSSTWELVPGHDLTSFSSGGITTITGADVFYVGMAPDPNNPGSFSGTAQDIGVYSGSISLPPK